MKLTLFLSDKMRLPHQLVVNASRAIAQDCARLLKTQFFGYKQKQRLCRTAISDAAQLNHQTRQPFHVSCWISDHKDGYALGDAPVASLSFQLPRTDKHSIPRTYEVNRVFRRQLELLASEEEDDEGMFDAAI